MDDGSSHVNEHSNSNDEKESYETVMTFGDEGLNYSDFENVEYEEVNGDLVSERHDDTSLNSSKILSRKRTRNFTQTECSIMCALIEEYSDILDVKRNDHKTNTLKNKTWADITQKFNNSTNEDYRTTLQLKTFYENMKKKRKRLCRESGNSEASELSANNFEYKPHIENHTTDIPSGFKRRGNFMEYYQRKKIELVEREIERVRCATEQQHKLFLLQEEKLLLEIEEIKERLKNK